MDVEKKTVADVEGTYVVTIDAGEKSSSGLDLRTSPDSKIVLIPQPGDDPATSQLVMDEEACRLICFGLQCLVD